MHKTNKAGKKSSQVDIIKGKLDISRSGMGYVIVEGVEKDIIVRPNDFNRAFHGDMVRVQINKGISKDKRIEGKIIDVAERKQTEFIGNIQMNKNFAFFIPASEKHIYRLQRNRYYTYAATKLLIQAVHPTPSPPCPTCRSHCVRIPQTPRAA